MLTSLVFCLSCTFPSWSISETYVRIVNYRGKFSAIGLAPQVHLLDMYAGYWYKMFIRLDGLDWMEVGS